MSETIILHEHEFSQEIILEDGLEAHTRLVQHSRPAIMRFIKLLQQERALRSLSFGAWEMSIPLVDYQMLIREIPALNSQDRDEHELAWRAFMANPCSRRYRVRELKRGIHGST